MDNITPLSNDIIQNITDPNEIKYIQSFSEKELKAYLIAKEHLMSSFSCQKSNGFIAFMKENGGGKK
jgi:hypothetical protein